MWLGMRNEHSEFGDVYSTSKMVERYEHKQCISLNVTMYDWISDG